MTLTIISHTEHYKTEDGIVGLAPTVMEINHLLQLFESIKHVGMLHPGEAPLNTLKYASNKIEFIALPRLGGKQIKDKINLFLSAPAVIGVVRKAIKGSDYFQFRAPTGIGVYVIPYLIMCSKRKGWFKYAGNWKQKNAPWSSSWQKWLLKNQSRKVTINGQYANQPNHCLSFMNPCLTQDEIKKGEEIRRITKRGSRGLRICFVGRLEDEKGFDLILKAFGKLSALEIAKIKSFEVVGEGESMEKYKKTVDKLDIDVTFWGLLSREGVHKIYMNVDVILLPSKSEGFPKVITEAMNYGCIPVLSELPSINSFIIHKKNGYIVSPLNSNQLAVILKQLLSLSPEEFEKLSKEDIFSLNELSYSFYNKRIENEVLY